MPSLDHSSGASELAELQSTGKPLVSLEGWARFEAKARNRRIERRLEAARAAIQTQRFVEARAAIAELREIDPSLPALPELAAQLALAEQRSAKPRVIGPYVAAAATFAALTLAASWVGKEDLRLLPLLRSTAVASTAATTPVVEASLPSYAADVPIDVLPRDAAAATSGDVGDPPAITPTVAAAATRPPNAVPVAPRAAEPIAPAPPVSVRAAEPIVPAPPVSVRTADATLPAPPVVPRELQPPPGAIVERTWEPPPSPPSRPPVEAVAASPAPASSPLNASAAPPTTGRAAVASAPAVDVDESSLVRDVLRRYQTAYDRLDAGLAHAVWPAVNEAALARAFGDLASQSITFTNCDVRLRADTAAAVCTGSARYTPKIGSREPRVEPRVWNFTLRKRSAGWLIETARAER